MRSAVLAAQALFKINCRQPCCAANMALINFRPLSSSTTGVTVGVPWIIFFGGLICAGLLTPSSADNRPIRTRDPFDQERHLEKDGPINKPSSELVEA